MLGVAKPVDILRHVGMMLAFTIILLTLPNVLMRVWLRMSIWQRIGLAAIGIGIWRFCLRRPRAPNPD